MRRPDASSLRGEITESELFDRVFASTPRAGHCNTMGTALSMNSLAEAIGMSLPGCAAIPAPYAERASVAYRTGARIVGMVHEDLTPSKIMTRKAFENAIVVTSAIGGSTNFPPHINTIAAHMGVRLYIEDWNHIRHGIGLMANLQPSGDHLGEDFYRAGGVPAIMEEFLVASELNGEAMTFTGETVSTTYGGGAL